MTIKTRHRPVTEGKRAAQRRPATRAKGGDGQRIDLARRVVQAYGGRLSLRLGIDVDTGEDQVERWFLAASLFGTRISATIVEHTYRQFDQAGVVRIDQALKLSWERLVELLDKGGYVRYDYRTATRLQNLAHHLRECYQGTVAGVARQAGDYALLRDRLDGLPGWGPVTVNIFLRELRGVWPGADPPLDARATDAARHLDLIDGSDEPIRQVTRLAEAADLDPRDLESGLVRLTLAHRVKMRDCSGGSRCTALARQSAG